MGSKGTELIYHVDSFNRDTAKYPESNDFALDLKLRIDVQMTVLGNIELPLSQYLVEEEWSEFLFDVGLLAPQTQASRTLSYFCEDFQTGDVTVAEVVVLPAGALFVTLAAVGPDYLEWTSAEPVGVEASTLPLLDWGVLYGAPSLSPPSSPSPVLAVVDEFTVRTALPAAPPAVGTPGALVVHSGGSLPFRSPEQLVSVITSNLEALEIPLKFSYDARAMRVCVDSFFPLQPRICDRSLIPCQQRLQCGVQSTPQASLLGFLRVPSGGQFFPLCGSQFPVCLCTAKLPIGQYTEASMRNAVELNLATLSCGQLPSGGMNIQVLGAGSFAFPIAARQFLEPTQVASSLSAQLAALWGGSGLPAGAEVVATFEQDTFVLSSPYQFAVMWIPDPSAQEQLFQRLGFDGNLPMATQHRGKPRHCSGCKLPVNVTLPTHFCGQNIALQMKYVFEATNKLQQWPPADLWPPTAMPLSPFLSLNVEPTGEVWSYIVVPVGQLVVTNDGAYYLRASQISTPVFAAPEPVIIYEYISAQTPLLAVGTYPALPFFPQRAVANFYFPLAPRTCWNRLAEILGFFTGANSFPSTGSVMQAPNAWCVHGPRYALLEIGLQHASATTLHRCGDDLKSQLLAVVLLYPPFKLERGVQMAKVGTGVSVVTQLQIRVLNPWHSLYVFHGRNWSMTLVFGSAGAPGRTDCP